MIHVCAMNTAQLLYCAVSTVTVGWRACAPADLGLFKSSAPQAPGPAHASAHRDQAGAPATRHSKSVPGSQAPRPPARHRAAPGRASLSALASPTDSARTERRTRSRVFALGELEEPPRRPLSPGLRVSGPPFPRQSAPLSNFVILLKIIVTVTLTVLLLKRPSESTGT